MRRVVFTGGPGAGKTTLLTDLGSRGYATVKESARSIIANRLRKNQTPRPDPSAFAWEILRLDIESYSRHPPQTDLVFYDRGVVDALCMLEPAAPLEQGELTSLLLKYAYYPKVFAFPPWQEIYQNDAERDQSFTEAELVHDRVTRWYRGCGYELIDVPKIPVQHRSEYVLGMLGRGDA
jgi:predicted ATPase